MKTPGQTAWKAQQKRMDLQNAEFDALRDLIKQFNRLEMTPVVDDDYPEMRHYYESSLREFIRKLKANRGNDIWTQTN